LEGVVEIWVTSEDTGAYGKDLGISIIDLLRAIIKLLPKHVMLRIGMTNPPYIAEHINFMVDILNHPQVFSFLHIPIQVTLILLFLIKFQSGSNAVLEHMQREYTVEDFSKISDFLLKYVKNLTLATDIICGYPSETGEDFDKTIELSEKYQFKMLNISQFYPRPGTAAFKMKLLPTKEVKSRSQRITKMFEEWDPYKKYLNTKHLVYYFPNSYILIS
jgi:threonylcarbamoyladenosine tRNA methylthiotransferase CDKAL1